MRMKSFVTALQFLTRINFYHQNVVSAEEFGQSVKFFPLVGAVIGLVLAGFGYLALGYFPIHVLAASLVVLELVLTGGIHSDGLMDTMDGVFSGRPRERMLEIMKDSRVGANAVMGFGALLLLKWSLILDLLSTGVIAAALFLMPVFGRLAMVIAVTTFSYARPEGIGKAFAQFAGRPALYFAFATAVIIALPLGKVAWISLTASVIFAVLLGRCFCKWLGGLTGDVYGAINELTELLVLIVFLSREWVLLWLR
ncbi:MAG: cobS [Firmicutes bacterium]|nr:cobS [Bacillota bacterium]